MKIKMQKSKCSSNSIMSADSSDVQALSTQIADARLRHKAIHVNLHDRLENDKRTLRNLSRELQYERKQREVLERSMSEMKATYEAERAIWLRQEQEHADTLREERKQGRRSITEVRRENKDLQAALIHKESSINASRRQLASLETQLRNALNERDEFRRQAEDSKAISLRLENETLPAMTLENERLCKELEGLRAELTETLEVESNLWQLFHQEQQTRRRRILERDSTN